MDPLILKQPSSSVFDKLASLKQWQSEQHEKLIIEQEKHRERLVEEQNKHFDVQLKQNTYSDHEPSKTLSDDEDSKKQSEEVYSINQQDCSVHYASAEERNDSNDRSFISNHEAPKEDGTEDKSKRIFPFLKRGQGLSRFRMSSDDLQTQKKRILPSRSKKVNPISEEKQIRPKQSKQSLTSTNKAPPTKPKDVLDHKEHVAEKVFIPRAPIPSRLKLNIQKKPPQPEKINEHKKSHTAIVQNMANQPQIPTRQPYINETSKRAWGSILTRAGKIDVMTSSPIRKVEQRELRVFERLEQMVDDSSFCSSSSVVTRFVEGGYISSVQTTPQSSPAKRRVESPLELEALPTRTNFAVENAKALLKELAALKFGPVPNAEPSEFWKECPENKKDDLKLDFSALKYESSSDEEELPKVLELTEEEWSKTSDSSDSDSSSEVSDVAQVLDQRPGKRNSALTQPALESSASSVSSGDNSVKMDKELVLGNVMHARLEQLQQEVQVVQEQQAQLNHQRSELAYEKHKLAKAIEDAEEQKRKYAGSKLQQQRENHKIDELKTQLEDLQTVWKEKEVRWASAQAGQRAQLKQLADENKKLAQQIKELKLTQGKKVHFARTIDTKNRALKPALKKSQDDNVTSKAQEDRVEQTDKNHASRITCARDLDDALKLYQSLGSKDTSPDTSLLTPKSIDKAYFEIFKSGDLDMSNSFKSSHNTTSSAKEDTQSQNLDCGLERLRAPIWSKTSQPEVNVDAVMRNAMPEKTINPGQVNGTGSNILKSEVHPDGTRQFWYTCGNTLKISADGTNRRMVFFNGDVQESWSREGVTRYFYSESRVWHENHRDGRQVISYPDGQKEVLEIDGSKEVTFPDGSSMCIDAEGKQTANLCDGSRLFLNLDGSSVLQLPNGLREIRTTESTTLQYPDGTVRVKFPSGLMETKYPNGRVRVKDATGKLIMDTHCPIDS